MHIPYCIYMYNRGCAGPFGLGPANSLRSQARTRYVIHTCYELQFTKFLSRFWDDFSDGCTFLCCPFLSGFSTVFFYFYQVLLLLLIPGIIRIWDQLSWYPKLRYFHISIPKLILVLKLLRNLVEISWKYQFGFSWFQDIDLKFVVYIKFVVYRLRYW